MVLAEKGVSHAIEAVRGDAFPKDIEELNPYAQLPTLVDRDLVLYGSHVVVEYLDERYPHPPMMPVDPVARARARLLLYRIDRDWCGQIAEIESTTHESGKKQQKAAEKAREQLRDSLTALAPLFSHYPFFMSDEVTVLDCAIAPILWRLPHLGIELPKTAAQATRDYALRLFARPSFVLSLTEDEREMR